MQIPHDTLDMVINFFQADTTLTVELTWYVLSLTNTLFEFMEVLKKNQRISVMKMLFMKRQNLNAN